jgi:hypothetical protein
MFLAAPFNNSKNLERSQMPSIEQRIKELLGNHTMINNYTINNNN